MHVISGSPRLGDTVESVHLELANAVSAITKTQEEKDRLSLSGKSMRE